MRAVDQSIEMDAGATIEQVVNETVVRETAAVCTEFLRGLTDQDWGVVVADVDMSIAALVAHIADGCLWYAIDLSAGGKDLKAAEHGVQADADNGDLVDTLETYANVVASVVGAASSSARGFHPLGVADSSGFAAMACDEMLVHTNDAAGGLGLTFRPPQELADQVLRRLFPWVDRSGDPWGDLLWANGRTAHQGKERLSEWVWHCAPLEEWDGEIPR